MSILVRFALLALFPGLVLAETPDAKRDPMQHFFAASFGDLQAEAADARRAGKRAIFLMYMRDDCPYCERMKANILSLERVQEHYRKYFTSLAIDLRGAVSMVDFTGKATTEKDFARAQRVSFTPVVVFYDLDGKEVTRVNGEIRDPAEFLLLGDFVATGAYRNSSFAQYKQSTGNKKGI